MTAVTWVTASAAGAVHDWFSWVVIFSNALAGLWALAAHRRSSLRSLALWATTVAAQVTVFVQAGLGTWLMVQEGRDAPELHALYGFSALVAVGIAYSYRQHLRSHLYVLYGCTGLFLMGLGIRAVILDSVA
ncbi:MAG: hypothetical protein J4F50_01915 [Acidimicrobiia bacterium]|nr:hypothetical protein [Acidimicrobiia bacterium]